jgi:endonuclease I
MIPAHKQTDKMKQPGQIVNDVTLADYYARKMKQKITFEEWWEQTLPAWRKEYGYNKEAFAAVWKAAQENMT